MDKNTDQPSGLQGLADRELISEAASECNNDGKYSPSEIQSHFSSSSSEGEEGETAESQEGTHSEPASANTGDETDSAINNKIQSTQVSESVFLTLNDIQSQLDDDPTLQARLDEEQYRMKRHYDERPRSPFYIDGNDDLCYVSGTRASGEPRYNRSKLKRVPSRLRVLRSFDDPPSPEASPESGNGDRSTQTRSSEEKLSTERVGLPLSHTGELLPQSIYVPKSGPDWSDDDDEERFKSELSNCQEGSGSQDLTTDYEDPRLTDIGEDVDRPMSAIEMFSPASDDVGPDRPVSRHGMYAGKTKGGFELQSRSLEFDGADCKTSVSNQDDDENMKMVPQSAGTVDLQASIEEQISPSRSEGSSVESTTGMTQSQGQEFARVYEADKSTNLVKQRSYLKDAEEGKPVVDRLPERPEDRIELLVAKVHHYRGRMKQATADLDSANDYIDRLEHDLADAEEISKYTGSLRKRLEAEQRECKRLQKERDQLKAWAESNDELAECERRRRETETNETAAVKAKSSDRETNAHLEASQMHPEDLHKELQPQLATLQDENVRLRAMLTEAMDRIEENVGLKSPVVLPAASQPAHKTICSDEGCKLSPRNFAPATASVPVVPFSMSSKLSKWIQREAALKLKAAQKIHKIGQISPETAELDETARIWELRRELYSCLCGWKEIPYVPRHLRSVSVYSNLVATATE